MTKTEERIVVTLVVVVTTLCMIGAYRLHEKSARYQEEKRALEEQQKAESKIEHLRALIHRLTEDKTH